MIDELSTRVAMTLASLAVLGSGLAFLGLAATDSMGREAQSLADHVARQIDGIARLDATVRFGGDNGTAPLVLPATIGGREYRLEVGASSIRVVVDSMVRVAALLGNIHPFPPQGKFGADELARLDASLSVILTAGTPFVVERTIVSLDGTQIRATFVYLPH